MNAILCFGASITFGRGEQPCLGWVGRLKNYFEAKDYYNAVYNLGISGNTSVDLLNRFEIECKARTKKKRPEDKFVILIGIGTNDSRFVDTPNNPQTTPDDFKTNISKLLEIAKKYSSEIVFVGLTPVDESKTNPYETTFFFNERVEQYNNIIKDSCNKENVLFVNLFEAWKELNYTKLLGDGLHPNSEGYDKMYESIKEFLIEKELIE